ncbi:hypothetical protein [Prevotella sp.]|uniref:hypothetical protein n=1 Tax=uncultured Prevotella sp. TaxID=159272 RepID=UPI0027E38EE4|nr:hypothetical protein [Prevotella sp.]
MKKLLLLLFVFLPLFANAQATIQEIPEWNLDQALNNCKKVVMHAYCWIERGVETDGPITEEEIVLWWDYPYGGCDIYFKAKKYANFKSRPLKVNKKYIDEGFLAYEFLDNNGWLLGVTFSRMYTEMHPNADRLYNGVLIRREIEKPVGYRILSVDFYNEAGECVVRGYDPNNANDIDSGNLLQCFIERMYKRYL